MNIRTFLTFSSCAIAAFMPAASHAHFLWATLNHATHKVTVGLQEVPSQEPLPLGKRSSAVKLWSAAESSLAIRSEGPRLLADATTNSVAASLDYGILDRRDAGRGLFWLKYYAKAAATLADSRADLKLPVDLAATALPDGRISLLVTSNGKPAAGADIVEEDKDGKPSFSGKTGEDGTVVLPAAVAALEVRALVTDKAAGTRDGQPYEMVRSYCTLNVENAATLRLTQLIHESFGDDHDIVGRTAFIKTLMAGKLTKDQLTAHFQQRALVHEVIDQVIGSASPTVAPYGEKQKGVISLLRNDMKSAGIAWPEESAAWPSTKELIEKIRQSAKDGPYFALGVMHVYYGGITHGGRQIGRIIETTLKVTPTYYLNSDGYRDYAHQVDEITDPRAQREMIRGGVAAYRYIISSNDLDIFKSKNSLSAPF